MSHAVLLSGPVVTAKCSVCTVYAGSAAAASVGATSAVEAEIRTTSGATRAARRRRDMTAQLWSRSQGHAGPSAGVGVAVLVVEVLEIGRVLVLADRERDDDREDEEGEDRDQDPDLVTGEDLEIGLHGAPP